MSVTARRPSEIEAVGVFPAFGANVIAPEPGDGRAKAGNSSDDGKTGRPFHGLRRRIGRNLIA